MIQIPEQAYDDLLTTWDSSVMKFQAWLIYVCGVEADVFKRAQATVKTEKDLNGWIGCFDGNFDNVALATAKYQQLVN